MRTKTTIRIPPALSARLADYAARKRVSQSAVSKPRSTASSLPTAPSVWRPRSPAASIA